MKKINLNQSIELANPQGKSVLYELTGLTAPIFTDLCSIALTVIDPGGLVIRHKHIQSEETYIFTKGSGQMIINGESVQVKEGDTILLEKHDVHELSADKNTGVEFYAISVPPFVEEDFIIV